MEVHAKFKLCADTLFLSVRRPRKRPCASTSAQVSLLDRYLALQTDTERSRLQLVGVPRRASKSTVQG